MVCEQVTFFRFRTTTGYTALWLSLFHSPAVSWWKMYIQEDEFLTWQSIWSHGGSSAGLHLPCTHTLSLSCWMDGYYSSQMSSGAYLGFYLSPVLTHSALSSLSTSSITIWLPSLTQIRTIFMTSLAVPPLSTPGPSPLGLLNCRFLSNGCGFPLNLNQIFRLRFSPFFPTDLEELNPRENLFTHGPLLPQFLL